MEPTDEQKTELTAGVAALTWQWIETHWFDLMAGVPAVLLTIFLVEFLKEPAKLYFARKLDGDYNERIENMIVRSLTLPAAFIWAATLNFTESWNSMLGTRLAWWQGMLVGTTMTAGLAVLVVYLLDYFKVAETARVRFQRLSGVTKDDIDAAKTVRPEDIRAELPEGRITEEMIEADRKKRESSD